ncbi:MAG: tetratricopeptide repeat protein [Egibacteraceae bacterium]
MVSKKDLDELEEIAKLRAHGRAQGWAIPKIVEAIADQFGVSLLKAHRLARGWTRPQAVEAILATYDADGWPRPKLTCQRLCAWEHDPSIRPGEEYLDRLCRVYETRPDQLGYGHDYTPAAQPAATSPNGQPALPATGDAGDESGASYAGTSATSLALTTREGHDAGHNWQSSGEEPAATDRPELLQAIGASGLAALLDRAGRAAVRLSSKLGSSNLGPVTIEQLELRITGFLHSYEHTLSVERLHALLAQQRDVEALLDGRQPLDERRQLYRIAGQLSALLGGTLFELGDYPNAHAHLLTALQLARQVGDHALIASTRVKQSTVALWAGDFRAALDYAQDGQRYATGVERARLAARCEARAYARMSQRSHMVDALQCANRAMPSQPVTADPDAAWSLFSPAALELYTAISLLWLGDAKQAESHARQAITRYETQPPLLQSPANHTQAKIILATCLVRQDHPDEGIRGAAGTLAIDRGHVEPNLQQASEFLTALPFRHRELPAARDFAEQLRSLRTPRTRLSPR